MRDRRWASLGLAIAVLGTAVVGVRAGILSDAVTVSGDSIARGFNANTGSCNYDDNVSRNFATGDNHGTGWCTAGAGNVFSHAERLECFKGADVQNFNHAASGATMRGDFFNQSAAIRTDLTTALSPRYIPVLMGHNDVCSNTTAKVDPGCTDPDRDPNNYCRTTPAAFEREFRRGMDQLIQVPDARIGVSAIVRVSELCNFSDKNGCGLTFFGDCGLIWSLFPICSSLTEDCSEQRRVDAYETALAYNTILQAVTVEYMLIPTGGTSATGAVRAAGVEIQYSDAAFRYKFVSSDISCCDCFHPADQGQAKLALFGWNGLQCSPTDQCCATTGVPSTDARCDVVDTVSFFPSGFWPNDQPCGNGIIDPMEQCDDGNAVGGDCCSATCQLEPMGAACTSDGNPCTDDTCNATGLCQHTANTATCNDGLFCTVSDQCTAGSCVGTPRDCTSAGDACNLGVCNETLDQCVPSPKPNGTACDDANACTQTDACQAGACVGANPIVCTALDQCHVVGTCQPATGGCTNPNKADGTSCTDGDACTQTDTCQSGSCTGANPVVCTALDQCHDAGTCAPATGVCSNPSKPNGTACSDGNGCTQTDTCQTGACSGANPVVCTPLDQCHDAGTCNPGTGLCSNPPAADGTGCNDGNLCTQVDYCEAGSCTGANPIFCSALDQCHLAGTCNPSTGVCSNPNRPNGATCNDADACTQTDTCQTGTCTGANPVVCSPLDQCHVAGTCNPVNGSCSNPLAPDGTACNDGAACTVADQCTSGACGGGPSCGDGVLQGGCAEACDDGASNGTNACCSATCTLVDGDGDGVCDRDDPCTGGTTLTRPKLKLSRVAAPAGDETLTLGGDAVMAAPFDPPLDPFTRGLRLLVSNGAGALIDLTLPAGAYDGTTGWVANATGTTLSYKSRALAPPGGISKLTIKNRSASIPGLLQVRAKGRGLYAVTPGDLPIRLTIVIDTPTADGGQCATADFGANPPSCIANASGTTISCR